MEGSFEIVFGIKDLEFLSILVGILELRGFSHLKF